MRNDYQEQKKFWLGVDLKIMGAAIAVALGAYLLGWLWLVVIAALVFWSSIGSLTTQIFPISHPFPLSLITFPWAAVQLAIMWLSQLKYKNKTE